MSVLTGLNVCPPALSLEQTVNPHRKSISPRGDQQVLPSEGEMGVEEVGTCLE